MTMRSLMLMILTCGMLFTSPTFAASTSKPMGTPDNDMKTVLDALANLNPKPIETLTPDEARQQPTSADAVKVVLKNKGKNPDTSMGVTTENISIPGPMGTILAARVYSPKHMDPKKPLPVIVYYHGGGFVIADLDTYDATPRAMAKAVNAIVFSCDYRHAPENKFPAAQDDALAAYQWILSNAETFGGDPRRVAIMGESAGGNLAINTSIAARDQHLQMPVYEVLIYPLVGVDMTTRSYEENANAKPLNKAMMGWFFNNLVKDDADKSDPRLDIIGKADLHGLPPTTVIADQIDPLRSEDEALIDKLKAAGVKTRSKTYSGVTHEFFGMGAVVSKAKDAESKVASDLKSAF